MGSPITYTPATPALARELAARMRPADAAEVLASDGTDPLTAVLTSVELSEPGTALAAFLGGELAALLGVVRGSFASGVAYPWCLTSDAVERHRGAFLKGSREVLDGWLERFPVLEQRVDARHRRALRWAARVGFEVFPPAPWGPAGLPFCRIIRRRDGYV